jgi:hypothetical protein
MPTVVHSHSGWSAMAPNQAIVHKHPPHVDEVHRLLFPFIYASSYSRCSARALIITIVVQGHLFCFSV